MAHMSPSYIRRVRLVCQGWSAYAGRFCSGLKPEYLLGGSARLAQRFPFLRVLDLSHCSEIVIHSKVAALLAGRHLSGTRQLSLLLLLLVLLRHRSRVAY